MAENSNNGDFCGSNLDVAEANIERSKFFIENYEIMECFSVGAHSSMWKAKNKNNRMIFLLKIIRKFKYGKGYKKVFSLMQKYK
jgi:hypothetical protein